MDVDETAAARGSTTAPPASVERTKSEIKSLVEQFEKDVVKSLAQLEGYSPQQSRRSCGRDRSSHAPGHFHREGLGRLFQEGSFPSMGPPRRSSTCTRQSTVNNQDTPVVHTNVWCDICKKGVVGVRHKCLDCEGEHLLV
jgi:hypothetical protein